MRGNGPLRGVLGVPEAGPGLDPVALGNAGPVGIDTPPSTPTSGARSTPRCSTPAVGQTSPVHRHVPGKAPGRSRRAAIPITIFALGRLSLHELESYVELGVSRIVLPPPSMDPHTEDEALHHLDRLSELVAALR